MGSVLALALLVFLLLAITSEGSIALPSAREFYHGLTPTEQREFFDEYLSDANKIKELGQLLANTQVGISYLYNDYFCDRPQSFIETKVSQISKALETIKLRDGEKIALDLERLVLGPELVLGPHFVRAIGQINKLPSLFSILDRSAQAILFAYYTKRLELTLKLPLSWYLQDPFEMVFLANRMPALNAWRLAALKGNLGNIETGCIIGALQSITSFSSQQDFEELLMKMVYIQSKAVALEQFGFKCDDVLGKFTSNDPWSRQVLEFVKTLCSNKFERAKFNTALIKSDLLKVSSWPKAAKEMTDDERAKHKKMAHEMTVTNDILKLFILATNYADENDIEIIAEHLEAFLQDVNVSVIIPGIISLLIDTAYRRGWMGFSKESLQKLMLCADPAEIPQGIKYDGEKLLWEEFCAAPHEDRARFLLRNRIDLVRRMAQDQIAEVTRERSVFNTIEKYADKLMEDDRLLHVLYGSLPTHKHQIEAIKLYFKRSPVIRPLKGCEERMQRVAPYYVPESFNGDYVQWMRGQSWTSIVSAHKMAVERARRRLGPYIKIVGDEWHVNFSERGPMPDNSNAFFTLVNFGAQHGIPADKKPSLCFLKSLLYSRPANFWYWDSFKVRVGNQCKFPSSPKEKDDYMQFLRSAHKSLSFINFVPGLEAETLQKLMNDELGASDEEMARIRKKSELEQIQLEFGLFTQQDVTIDEEMAMLVGEMSLDETCILS